MIESFWTQACPFGQSRFHMNSSKKKSNYGEFCTIRSIKAQLLGLNWSLGGLRIFVPSSYILGLVLIQTLVWALTQDQLTSCQRIRIGYLLVWKVSSISTNLAYLGGKWPGTDIVSGNLTSSSLVKIVLCFLRHHCLCLLVSRFWVKAQIQVCLHLGRIVVTNTNHLV